MNELILAIRKMIEVSEEELQQFLSFCHVTNYSPKAMLSQQGEISNEIFFISKGMTRSLIVDHAGEEHTIHFSSEYQFIADYTSFMQQTPANNSIQAIEETTAVVLPRQAITWGYENLKQGDKLGRSIAEYYFIYFDNRLKNQYVFTPAQRYENITKVFPNIHNRVPQHMIASFLGISAVHLSRLKKEIR